MHFSSFFHLQSGLCSSSEMSTSRGSIRIQHLTSAASILKDGAGAADGDGTDLEEAEKVHEHKVSKFPYYTDKMEKYSKKYIFLRL